MFKKKITFKISHLKCLLESETSCVSLVQGFRGKLSLLPFHLGYLKHAVKELLDDKVSKYDQELNGIILGHSNIKVINYLHHSDGGRIHLSYIADVYLFSPSVGKTVTGVINKKTKEHIGCLIHSAFNASIPKPRGVGQDLSAWLRTSGSVKVGSTLDFCVSKVDFSTRVPYIGGVIVRTESDPYEDEGDSGVCCKDSEDIVKFKRKKKKIKVEDNCSQDDINDVGTSYHDPERISELLDSSYQIKKGKRRKSEVVESDGSNDDKSKLKEIKTEILSPEHGSGTPKGPKASKSSHSSQKGYESPVLLGKIKKERKSMSPCVEALPSTKKQKKRSLNVDDLNCKSLEKEESVDDLTSSLLKEAMEKCFSPRHGSSTSSDSDRKKKKKRSTNKDSLDGSLEQHKPCTSGTDLSSAKYLDNSKEDPTESKRGKKRKVSLSASETEDSILVKPKKRKKSRSRVDDDLEALTSSLLADAMTPLK